MINTGAYAEFMVSVDNHTLSVIEADATLVNPYSVQRLPIHVAQRYSFVLNANMSTETNYWMRANMITGCFTYVNPVLVADLLGVVSYSGNATLMPTGESVNWSSSLPTQCIDLSESDLVPLQYDPPPAAARMYQMDFSFVVGANTLVDAVFNGTTWSPLTNTSTLLEATAGMTSGDASAWDVDGQVGLFNANQLVMGVGSQGVEVVDILISSQDDNAHPFHLHGHTFVSLARLAPFFRHSVHNTVPSPAKSLQKLL